LQDVLYGVDGAGPGEDVGNDGVEAVEVELVGLVDRIMARLLMGRGRGMLWQGRWWDARR
jgi:hypothetical protein